MRVLLTVLMALLLCVTSAPAQPGQHMTMTNDTLKWVEPPTFPGAKLAVVQGDPGKEGPFVYRVKFPANYKIAPHYHKAAENVTVLSGTFFIGMGEKFDQGSGKELDRKSTRLNSSHQIISYAVFCLKKKKDNIREYAWMQ